MIYFIYIGNYFEITLLAILFFAFGHFRNLLGTQIQAQLFQTN